MPGLEVINTSLASPGHLDPPQLRAHKSLRRRPNVLWNPQVKVIEAAPRGPIRRPSNGAPLATAPVRPLTPPAVAQPEDLSSDGTNTPKAASSLSVNGVVTPKPSHPPTPETTPPQLSASANRPGLSHFGQSSSSSRADSFRTACEMISDAETEIPRRSSQSVLPTRQKTVRPDEPFDYHDRSGDSTPVPEPRPDRVRPAMTEPAAHGKMEEERERPKLSHPRRKKSTRKGARIPRAADSSERRFEESDADESYEVFLVQPESPQSPPEPVRDSQEPVGGLSIEEFREQVDWPQTERRLHPAEPDGVRRLSDISTSSTVEVMIIDPPQSTQRSLRHTEKRDSLRSVSPHIPRSEHASLTSNSDSQHRLVHKAGRITEHDRKSIASEISISLTSSMNLPPQNVDVVPVVVIPERRSSLKSSSSSRNTSQTRSRHSSRRDTASGSRPGSREPPRQKKRTLSDTNSTTGKGAEPRGRHSGRPTIPPRNSSLSAPTSRNNSRATSLTSESLRDHALAMEHDTPPHPAEPPLTRPEAVARGPDMHDAAEASKTQSIIIGVEDMSHLCPPSMPYTQISIPSSSPGLIEVSEARTVAFFPHTNESLLLVDPQTQSTPRGQVQGSEYPFKRPDSPTPRHDMKSPLKNPRQPPQPPVCRVIPPTPVQDADRQPTGAGSKNEPSGRPSRRFGPGRRPWMVRPRSESFNSFVRSFSLTSVKNRKAGKDIDGRLQPFWRPRRFWDDSEPEEDSPRGPLSPRTANPEADLVIKNSLGMPQQRVVFEGPPLPRSPDARRRLEAHNANRSTLVGSQVFSPEAFCSQTSLHHHRYRSLSWWRLRLRAGKMRNIRRRVRRTWQKHADHRREAKREKLKQSISPAVLVESSTQLKTITQ
ncbi:hypothetical protein BO71DRAFT_400501 [Aspergillus ellipticus CBS 707.79]|uniref:Uncharacterized protein n=1 Tax=Aspergillus ellipticus CBS 707.79 TaxID=1448320 RepID=A0A319D4S1_9EURO|nr:hypothetical protein BO71DRAFT_400501 [Aspergillus ellipticus CBS 707.79]